MLTIKTDKYDNHYHYTVGAWVFVKNDKFTVESEDGRKIPFGYVVKGPSRTRKMLEIRINTSIFEIKF